LIFLFLLNFVIAKAEGPETILPRTKILKPVTWYAEQAKHWQERTSILQNDPTAWLNYYTAARFGQQTQKELYQIVAEMKKNVFGTYEYFLADAWNSGFNEEAYVQLQKAYHLNPQQPGAYGLLTLFSEYNLNADKRFEFSTKLMNSGLVSQSLLNYSYNVLMSLEQETILFTEGESTTLPLFVLQDVFNIRKDITILNLDLLLEPAYLERKFKTNGLNFTSAVPANVSDLRVLLCALMPSENTSKKFYYALTLPKENISSIKNQLYVVGLASQFSAERMDNLSVIKENLEKNFMMDYLTVDFNGESEYATGRVLSANYLVSILLLYEAYQKENNLKKLSALNVLLKKIAFDTGKENLVTNFLDQKTSTEIPYAPYALNIKSLNYFRPFIEDKLYVNEAEVTNLQYNEFLNYLIKNNFTEQYEKYKFDFADYTEPALSLMKGYSFARIPTKKDKYFTDHPAVNISYEAALAYCEWLTQHYNNSSEKKFKKVKFRLPSIQEFQLAAASIKNPTSFSLEENIVEVKIYKKEGVGFSKDYEVKRLSLADPEVRYPWFRFFNFGNTAINNKGCYLGNFKVPDSIKSCQPAKRITADAFLAMGPVKSYFPNDIGLYDVVGNVAEMTLEKGKACGGSWNHSPEESTFKSINSYEKPDASIGFRVYMEIIEQ
jgi:formylglycine-generating enzyme required for sulfatase activity